MRVLLCDDHPGYRMMLSIFMAADPDLELVGEAASVAQLLELAEVTPFDVALVDIQLSGGDSGLDGVRALRAQRPDAAIVSFSSHADRRVEAAALEAGADAVLAKELSAAETLAALKDVAPRLRGDWREGS